MRFRLLPLLLLTAACNREDAPTNAADATGTEFAVYAAEGRDRMCLSLRPGGKAGVITYAGTSDSNCSMRGTWTDGPAAAINPTEDPSCSVPVESEGDVVTLGRPTPGCAYYCGPGASLEGKTFVRMDKPDRVTDLAGDPLC